MNVSASGAPRWFLAGALFVLAGCVGKKDEGPQTVPVEAKAIMTKGGTIGDLANASIAVQFESVDQPGVIAYGAILEDGTLTVATQTPTGEKPGLVPGKHRVRLNADERAAQQVSPKLLEYHTSGLTVSVPSDQPIEIKLWK
jgi:hypothetical protein